MCKDERGAGPIPILGPLDPLTEHHIEVLSDRFQKMNAGEILKHFDDWYDFRDAHGQPLTHVLDFLALVRLARPDKPIVRTMPKPNVRMVPG